MREHVHIASRRRDERLALIRKVTLWITGGAAAASLGLGTAFAHAVAGHAASSSSTPGSGASARSAAPSRAGSATSARPAASGSGQGSQPAQLVQPQQQPAHTTAPPVVKSGGS